MGLTTLMLVLAMAVGPFATDAAAETRTFTRTGSLGRTTDIELYLLQGEYRHELRSECEVAASLFPADREPAVALRDVLQADLITDGSIPDEDSLVISGPGWVNLQVGTGRDCEWSYAITGLFVPVGEEPSPPRSPDDLGGVWVPALFLLAVVASVVLVARTRRTEPVPSVQPEPVVKVWVAPPPE